MCVCVKGQVHEIRDETNEKKIYEYKYLFWCCDSNHVGSTHNGIAMAVFTQVELGRVVHQQIAQCLIVDLNKSNKMVSKINK